MGRLERRKGWQPTTFWFFVVTCKSQIILDKTSPVLKEFLEFERTYYRAGKVLNSKVFQNISLEQLIVFLDPQIIATKDVLTIAGVEDLIDILYETIADLRKEILESDMVEVYRNVILNDYPELMDESANMNLLTQVIG